MTKVTLNRNSENQKGVARLPVYEARHQFKLFEEIPSYKVFRAVQRFLSVLNWRWKVGTLFKI